MCCTVWYIYDTITGRTSSTGAIYLGRGMFHDGILLYYLPFVDFLVSSLVLNDDILYKALVGELRGS